MSMPKVSLNCWRLDASFSLIRAIASLILLRDSAPCETTHLTARELMSDSSRTS
jgi:hypothetical protein